MEPAPEVVTYAVDGPEGAAPDLARCLGAPDTLLSMLPASALSALSTGASSSSSSSSSSSASHDMLRMHSAAAGPAGIANSPLDLAGLAGVTSLRLPDLSSSAAASSGVGAALARVLTRHTCTLKYLQLPGCHPDIAAEVASAALACASLATLSFGGLALPVGVIRKSIGRSVGGNDGSNGERKGSLGLTELDLTAGAGVTHRGGGGGSGGGDGGEIVATTTAGASGGGGIDDAVGDIGGGGGGGGSSGGRSAGVATSSSSASSSDGGIGDAELASLAAMLGGVHLGSGGYGGGGGAYGGGGGGVAAKIASNSATMTTTPVGRRDDGLGRTVTSLALPPWLSASTVQRVVEAIGCAALPSINGVPATVGALDAAVDLTGTACGVPGALALTGALRALGGDDDGGGSGGGGGGGGGGGYSDGVDDASTSSTSATSAVALRLLALGGTSLGVEGGEMLAEALSSAACRGLERLLLPGAGLGPGGVEAVCAALPPGVLLLDLGSNNCGDRRGCSSIHTTHLPRASIRLCHRSSPPVMRNTYSPHQLSLKSHANTWREKMALNPKPRGAKAAGDALRRCPKLRVLGLAANDIGAEGARMLAPAVRDHAALEELHAAGNRAGDRGAAALATAIRATKAPFTRLMLGENFNVAAAGAKALAAAAAASPTLLELNLCKAMIGAEGAKALGAALAETRNLRVLELSWRGRLFTPQPHLSPFTLLF